MRTFPNYRRAKAGDRPSAHSCERFVVRARCDGVAAAAVALDFAIASRSRQVAVDGASVSPSPASRDCGAVASGFGSAPSSARCRNTYSWRSTPPAAAFATAAMSALVSSKNSVVMSRFCIGAAILRAWPGWTRSSRSRSGTDRG